MKKFRQLLHSVIFGTDTCAGRTFDIILLWSILISILTVLLESVGSVRDMFPGLLVKIEYFFTALFTIEYILRIISSRNPLKYVFSFLGIIDLLSIIPTYLMFYTHGARSFMVLRAIRLLRVFRILKLARYLGEANFLLKALRASREKIIIFLGTVLTLTLIMGTIMYLVEGEEHGFTSIPKSIYWAIVTMTTVGYGDITPQTFIGQTFSAIIMITGYSIIAVPTGIISVELSNAIKKDISSERCSECDRSGHDYDASYCKYCGAYLKNIKRVK